MLANFVVYIFMRRLRLLTTHTYRRCNQFIKQTHSAIIRQKQQNISAKETPWWSTETIQQNSFDYMFGIVRKEPNCIVLGTKKINLPSKLQQFKIPFPYNMWIQFCWKQWSKILIVIRVTFGQSNETDVSIKNIFGAFNFEINKIFLFFHKILLNIFPSSCSSLNFASQPLGARLIFTSFNYV